MKQKRALGLTNKFLDDMGRKLSPLYFEGTFPCDVLLREYKPTREKKEKSIVFVNTSESIVPTGHYNALNILWKSECVYLFDSLALGLVDPNIIEFIRRFLKQYPNFTLDYSPYPLQHLLNSAHCGIHSLAYLVSQDKHCGHSTEDFYSFFRPEPVLENDNLALQYLLHFISNCYPVQK